MENAPSPPASGLEAGKGAPGVWRGCFRWLKRAVIFSAGLLALMALVYWRMPRPDLLPPELEYSRTVLDRDGKVIFLTTTREGRLRLPVRMDEIAPTLLEATLEMEDRRFFQHHGVDGKSLLRAVWGVLSGQKLGGGSTLTMQLSRLRWQLRTRSVGGKLQQLFRALQLERHYSKQEIAAAYFTLAPYGGNVEGARAAAFRWCGKAAWELTLREAASLSAIPQSPRTRRPKAGGNPLLAAAQARLMSRLRAAQGEPPNELDAEFHLEPTPIPREAPHLSRRRLREDPQSLTVSSTLDRPQQRIMEQSIADFLERWRPQGLRNAAAILLHAPSREIRASVGSAGFHDLGISGQVDGTRASRSPGSTLKPFLYALSLDAGLIQPQTLLDDAPRRFSGYNPENSDRHFLGPIAASEALRLSRNVPAVELAWRLPNGGLEAFLRSSGIRLPPDPGLALAIGATEMRLEDLAGLYAELADPQQGRLSPAACWLTLDALLSREPGAPAGLSCKTGTSNGFRDAWACGVMGDWVLCVWIGHFDGHGMPGLFARGTAAPLLWQTVTKLKLPAKSREESRPAEVTPVPVCAVSGDLAGKHCSHCQDGWFIGGVSPITSCQVHQKIGDTVVEVWSADRLAQFRKAGFPRAATALSGPTNPTAQPTTASGPPPRILSPQPALTYYIQANAPQQNRLLLQANAAPGIQQIHWFAGNRYLGASPPAEPLPWQPLAGDYEVQAMDDAGRVATAKIRVRLAIGK